MKMPSFEELPIASSFRSDDEFLRLLLIPEEDETLRAAAIELFKLREAEDDIERLCAFRDGAEGISSVRARTPAGIAWKIASALSYFKEVEDWVWWRYLLQSALIDAIDLERLRASETREKRKFPKPSRRRSRRG